MTVASIQPAGRSRYSDAEWRLRVDLAACYRLVALHGWDDLVATHISARLPGEGHAFLINPFGLTFEEITASSLLKIDQDGRQLEESPYQANAAGFTIHSAVHEARPDAGCVIHLHTLDGMAVSATDDGLLPLNQTALFVTGDIAYHDYEGVAVDLDERVRIQRDLGERHHMILRNHGTLAVGGTVAEAFVRIYMLERSCSAQVRTLSMGRGLYPVQAAAAQRNDDIGRGMRAYADLAWPALLRRLDRQMPGYDA